MFRKDAFQKAGGFAAMYIAEDYDLWLRLAQEGKVANLENCNTRYYVRQNGAAKKGQQEMHHIILGLIRKYRNKFPNYLLAKIAAYTRMLLRRDQ